MADRIVFGSDHAGLALRAEAVRVAREAPERMADLARRGTVVLVMRNPGLLELLFARWIAPRLGLGPLRAAAGYRGLSAKLLGVRRSPPGFAATVCADATTAVFLGPGRNLAPFVQLLAIRDEQERPIYLVPALLTWSRRTPRLEGSAWDLLYGSPEAPSTFANGEAGSGRPYSSSRPGRALATSVPPEATHSSRAAATRASSARAPGRTSTSRPESMGQPSRTSRSSTRL